MRSLFGFLICFSALTATSDALSCTECISDTSPSCTGSSVTCASGSTCASLYSETVIGSSISPIFIRSCLNTSNCGFMGSMSNRQGRIWASMTCCNTDNCTPTIPTIPVVSTIPNGVICPSCMSNDPSACSSSDTVTCTGDEDTCVLEKTKITGTKNTLSH
ncbi:uncharacterized protein RB166_010994 [Leptodactylus fuscus]